MTIIRLILQNIRHYARSWLLTLAGAIIGTAVLTGALITGDSVRYSLTSLVSMRLGKAEFALAPADRFFRQDLARELSASMGVKIISIIRTSGTVSGPGQDLILNRAEIIGINEGFCGFWEPDGNETGFPLPAEDEAVISKNVETRLKVKPGDYIVVRISGEGFAPANAPFVSEKTETYGLRLRIKAVTSDNAGGRFSLQNNQSAPFNIFIPEKVLALKMGVPGYANTLLVSAKGEKLGTDSLNKLLQRAWTPADAGLLFSEPGPGLRQIVSRRIFIEDTLSAAIRKSIPGGAGVLTYLVNDISLDGRSTPYSFVTAADHGVGPGTPGSGQIVINDWLARDIGANPGDSLTLRYWTMGPARSLIERSKRFKVHSVVPLENNDSNRALMPDFPGMKNTGNCRDWETGAPVDLKRIRAKDEDYWNRYRGTPKAWISLADGQKIWKNPFGSLTAFRFSNTISEKAMNQGVRQLDPTTIGLSFKPVFEEGLKASANSTNFGDLFLSLGALIVFAGLLLSGLLLSLFLRQRSGEMQLMRAIGFRNRMILHVFFPEILIVSLAGGLIGILAAILYSQLIISSLNSLWQGAVHTSSLILNIRSGTLLTGFVSGVILNLMIFSFILFRSRKRSLPSVYDKHELRIPGKRLFRKTVEIAIVILLFYSAIVIMLAETFSGRFYPSTAFMIAGILVLAGTIEGISVFLTAKAARDFKISSGLIEYITRNVLLHRMQTIVTIILLAIGTFAILVTGLNRKGGGHRDEPFSSGTGGFSLWMETTLPVNFDLNSKEGGNPSRFSNNNLCRGCRFIPLPGLSGDDASCLNLNQVSLPGLLGVPAGYFDKRGSFSFVNLVSGTNRSHPWKTLENTDDPVCINGFADQSVITWGMHRKTGDTVQYKDESGKWLKIRIAGGLENSVFQGSLLVSDSLLRLHFPSSARIRKMLIDVPRGTEVSVSHTLEERFHDQGATVIPAGERLASFEVVENTYLDVFIVLGALGLLIGTAGLAVLVLRNLHDRRREIALYIAIGFPAKLTYWLLAGEFLFILFSGIVSGMIAAMAGTLPSLFATSEGLIFPVILIVIVVVNGILWIHFPVTRTLKHLKNHPFKI